MARPLRIDQPGGWYHLTSRGNERRRIFRDTGDCEHFLELLGELVARFRWRIHTYVLMNNHYHLEVETAEANLSSGMHWLQVSYSVWFNRRHRRVGHLFQGRFKAIVLEPDEWGIRLSHYIHLNPVRVARLGLDKLSRARKRAGAEGEPDEESICKRLEVLRAYQWSSYRSYVGLEAAPEWLESGWVLGRMGAKKEATQQRIYREEAERLIGEGTKDQPWDELVGGILLGAERWVQEMRGRVKGNEKEQPEAKALKRRPEWKQVVRALEEVKGEEWDEFRDRYGDWGRNLALLLGRRECGLQLGELGRLCGELDYRTVGSAISKVMQQLKRDSKLKATYDRICKSIEAYVK